MPYNVKLFSNIMLAPGALMSFAWGVLAPTGIFLALFYKIVWPNGQWFYVSKSC